MPQKKKNKSIVQSAKGVDETINSSALKSDMAASKDVKEEAFSQVTVEAHSVESVVVRETKMQMTAVSVEPTAATTTAASVKTGSKAEIKTETKNGPSKQASGWDNLFIKKQVALGVNKPEIPAVEIEELPDDFVLETSETVTKNMMEKILFEYFYQKITSIITTSIVVTNKVFRRKIGFGFISENDRYFKSKAVRVDRSLFFNEDQQQLVMSLIEYHPYSEVYNIWQMSNTEGRGKTFFIFRHFLKWNSLTEEQRRSLKVATTLDVGGSKTVVFVDPIFVDEEYVMIDFEQSDGTWFWVVSKFGNLPVRMRSMFERKTMTSLTCSMSLRGLTLFQKLMLGSFSLEF